MKIKNNFYIKIKRLITAFLFGLKNTEIDIFGQKTTISEANTIQQKQQMNELGEALLKGEVTQEVEFLRDRVYTISDESKKYTVITDTVGTSKAFKKMAKKQPPKCYGGDFSEIKLVFDNNEIRTGVLEALDSVGDYEIKRKFPITFEYEYTPKYNLTEYITKAVVRNYDNELLLDLYVPKYTDSINRIERIFNNEIKKIKDGRIKSNNLLFNNISFITNKTYGSPDLIPHKITIKNINSINEFNGFNVITYSVDSIEIMDKITDKYKNEKFRKSYESKESRNRTLNLSDTVEKCYCEKCGNEMDIYDYRITKKTNNVATCKKCLEKH